MTCEKCGKSIPEKLDYCPTCKVNAKAGLKRVRAQNTPVTKTGGFAPPPPNMSKSGNNTSVKREFEETVIVQTNEGAKDGQNKCPKCGATEISLVKSSGRLRCHFCRHDFKPEKFERKGTGISELKGLVLGSGTQDIVADAKDILTFKCDSCSAEVVIDTSEALQAKCHWCRNTLSVNEQIPNGAVPDMVLPFSLIKQDAQDEIHKFVEERKFFAHPEFSKTFCTENIMAVYLPYMVVDINATAVLTGQGEILTRTRPGGRNRQTTYDADVYNVERKFDLIISGMTVEASKEKLQHLSGEKTNNIINAIKPFDTENAVNWNPNYLKGCTSEKRDVNVEQLSNIVDTKATDIARFNTNSTLNSYNRGVCWSKEELTIKGKKWKAAYLPVWLYSYQSVNGNKKLLHYVAVNARSKKTMGSVPLNKPKLLFFTAIIQIICTIIALYGFWWIALWGGEELSVIPLVLILSGPAFYGITYKKYRNLCARHKHEEDTNAEMKNIEKIDKLIQNRKRLKDKFIKGMNNQNISNKHKKKWWDTDL